MTSEAQASRAYSSQTRVEQRVVTERPSGSAKGSSVAFEAISKSYGRFKAVQATDLMVGAGEFLSILGPSGSGKTTLLMMLAGFETASSGRIKIGAREVTHLPPNKRDIGMVFQRYALFPHMTVAQNVAFPLRMRGIPKDRARTLVDKTLSLVQLDEFRDRKPSELSGGQQQRVAVARALVFEPPVLLMDEPLGALDKKLREELQYEIKNLHRQVGVTIVYVTHDQEEALTMSDRIAVMNRGRIEQIDTSKRLYFQPSNTFVAGFLGKMNFIPATLVSSSADSTVVRVAGQPLTINRDAPSLDLNAGDQVLVTARPEALRITREEVNSVPGMIEAVTFVGSFTAFRVRLDSGALVEIHTNAAATVAEGAAVRVGFDAAEALLFAGSVPQ